MKQLTIGILAHVDAGKTTLSESILYLRGKIRKLGRVDHKDAFLDTYELEKDRGITIFSKQAVFDLGEKKVTLLDTPGHADFSAEMERTLQVLDYAILVINGADGVQAHTKTLWNLLKRYRVPVFLFVNKMDQETADKDALLYNLTSQLDEMCIEFPSGMEWNDEQFENVAMSDEDAMEEYLESGQLSVDTIRELISCRRVFPCYFGSALKVEGVHEFLDGFDQYTDTGDYPQEFGAKVYKISRDSSGNRLTHMKITGGKLKVRDLIGEEKINQIRIYSGEKFEAVQEVCAGCICAVTGLSDTYPGQGLGNETESVAPMLEPVLSYHVILPENTDAHTMMLRLKELEEEDPMLHILWNPEPGEIQVQLMGEIQIEILKSLVLERYGVSIDFDKGNIVYKETIENTVEGVGHFEPLRHYAEVHLIMEPAEPGSGLIIGTDCSEDMLDKNWQRLILTHLCEKEHRGVLTGSVITDMKITLVAGKAHLKHTEGGDFRQATYRAVRQGLMQAKSVLLEPYYSFSLEVPSENVGRAINDIQKMHGEFKLPETDGDMSILVGNAPVSLMRDYQMEVIAYTRGRGRLFCSLQGYQPCHNAEEVIEEMHYYPNRDVENPTGSVFCAHGAGVNIPWNEVFGNMHIESQLKKRREKEREEGEERKRLERNARQKKAGLSGKKAPSRSSSAWNEKEEKELEDIFLRTYGKIERRTAPERQIVQYSEKKSSKKAEKEIKEYLLVDGYNLIFAWDELKELALDNLEAAKGKLMDILSNYQGYKQCALILVFDAYKVEGGDHVIQQYYNIPVIYTKEAETADQYIEKVVHELGRKYHVTVVTSDGVEQVITAGQGATIISSREFVREIEEVKEQIREEWDQKCQTNKTYLFDYMDEELAADMEKIRLGEKEPEEL